MYQHCNPTSLSTWNPHVNHSFPRVVTQLLLVLIPSFCLSTGAHAQAPAELSKWKDWILEKHPERECPVTFNSARKVCIWSNELKINASNTGARFSLNTSLASNAQVVLPGNHQLWPTGVRVNNEPRSVVATNSGLPSIALKPGDYLITGALTWAELPRTVQIPSEPAFIRLTVNNQPITTPRIADNKNLWLSRDTESQAQQEDSLSIKVRRKLSDNNPAVLITHLDLAVSGSVRDVNIGTLLPNGFHLTNLESQLPAALNTEGIMSLQVRPGRWTISATAMHIGAVESIRYTAQPPYWPRREIWFFEDAPDLRTVSVTGGTSIDPSTQPVPAHWQNLPAYLLPADIPLRITTLHRGDPQPPGNILSLKKDIWLNFDGAGYTIKDHITGTMNNTWRLTMDARQELGNASIQGKPIPVTTINEPTLKMPAGVEVRTQALNVETVSRSEKQASLLVSGWNSAFDNVDLTFHLPPGWSLLHLTNADQVHGTWLMAWSLWDIFLVLLFVVIVWRYIHPMAGLLAGVSLLVLFHRANAPITLFILTIGLFVVSTRCKAFLAQPVVPSTEEGTESSLSDTVNKFRSTSFAWFKGLSYLSLALFLIVGMNFFVTQARSIVYPQLSLENNYRYSEPERAFDVTHLNDPQNSHSKVGAEVDEAALREMPLSLSSVKPKRQTFSTTNDAYRLNSAPDLSIQAGPSVPTWRWKTVHASWSSSIRPSDEYRVYLTPPWLNRIGALLCILLPFGLLFYLFCRMQGLRIADFGQHLKQTSSLSVVFVIPLLGLFLSMLPGLTHAAESGLSITDKLLREYEQRLTQPPDCLPQCAAINSVELSGDDEITISLAVSTQTALAFPLPSQQQGWWMTSARRDNLNATLTHFNNHLYIELPAGTHEIQLTGIIVNNQATLDFQLPLHNFTVSTDAYRIDGLSNDEQPSTSIEIHRLNQRSEDLANTSQATPLTPVVRVNRYLNFDNEWTVRTRVERLGESDRPFTVDVNLLPEERPTRALELNDSTARIEFLQGQNDFQWDSLLPLSSPIELVSTVDDHMTEMWSVTSTPRWHVDYEGIPPLSSSTTTASPRWQPWQDDSITLTVARPIPLAGNPVSLDKLTLDLAWGKRTYTSTATLDLRATQGTRYDFAMPIKAKPLGVSIDGQVRPVPVKSNVISIPLNPGKQSVEIRWETETGMTFASETPRLRLPTEVSNIHLNVNPQRDRFIVFLTGPALGPVVLIWGVLLLLLLILPLIPNRYFPGIKKRDWFLLSLGVATFTPVILLMLVVCVCFLHWRGKITPDQFSRSKYRFVFNASMTLAITFIVLTLGAVISSIPYSLLAQPDMYITGNQSTAHALRWYADYTPNILPKTTVYSVPSYVYRLCMLVWSFWLALAFVRWIRWGAPLLTRGGLRSPRLQSPEPD